MWVYSNKQNVWVNLDKAVRISKDGNGGYLVTSIDGKSISIDNDTYEKALKWIDPDWWEKHPNGNEKFDIPKVLKAIAKATGAKFNDKKKEEEEEDN